MQKNKSDFNSLCLKMAIITLGSAQKIRVGRESGNTSVIFFGVYLMPNIGVFP